MQLTSIAYNGKKPYQDREVRYMWAPGDVKPVPATVAAKLLRYPEFAPSNRKATKAEQEQAEVLRSMAKQQEQDDYSEKEGMLLTVEAMDKGALKTYAAKYEVSLDARKSDSVLRQEVSTLIEQFGVR